MGAYCYSSCPEQNRRELWQEQGRNENNKVNNAVLNAFHTRVVNMFEHVHVVTCSWWAQEAKPDIPRLTLGVGRNMPSTMSFKSL